MDETKKCTGCIPANGEAPDGHVAFAQTDCPVHGVDSEETRKELTTAEAFATLVALTSLAKHYGHPGKAGMGEAAITTLERRMGAMGRVFEGATRVLGALSLGRGPEADRQRVRDIENLTRALRDAQSDAPPVFALEEVEGVLHAYVRPEVLREALTYLASLRR